MPPTIEELEERLIALEGQREVFDPTLVLPRDLVDLAEVPSIKMRQTSAQTLSNQTDTKITLEVTDWDTMGGADLGNNDIIIRRSALYFILGGVRFVSNTTGVRYAGFTVNDTLDGLRQGLNTGSSNTARPTFCDLIQLKVGDTVQLRGFQQSTANLDTSPLDAVGTGMPYIALIMAADLPSNLA